MKKIIALGIIILAALNSFGQTNSTARGAALDTLTAEPAAKALQGPALQDNTKEIFRKNIVKFNLSSFALYNNSLSYERSLSRKTTFVAGYRFMPKVRTTTPYGAGYAIEKFKLEEDVVDDLNTLIIGNHTFTGEIRFYGGEKSGARGFYLSVYGRYMDMSIAFPYQYETEEFIYTIPFKGAMKGFAGGLMIGAQWLIAKRVTFDWYILGGHYGKLKIGVPASTDLSTMTPAEKEAFRQGLVDEFDILNNNAEIDATVTDQGPHLRGTIPFIGMRGLGFSLGIAF